MGRWTRYLASLIILMLCPRVNRGGPWRPNELRLPWWYCFDSTIQHLYFTLNSYLQPWTWWWRDMLRMVCWCLLWVQGSGTMQSLWWAAYNTRYTRVYMYTVYIYIYMIYGVNHRVFGENQVDYKFLLAPLTLRFSRSKVMSHTCCQRSIHREIVEDFVLLFWDVLGGCASISHRSMSPGCAAPLRERPE
jgi:hypothetical protein